MIAQTEPTITLSVLVSIIAILITIWIASIGWFIAKCSKQNDKIDALTKELNEKPDDADLKEVKEDLITLMEVFDKGLDKIEARLDKVVISALSNK